MAQHTHYWSCSKFADWLRGTPKGGAKTGRGWNDWHKEASFKYPIRYWIAEEALDWIQDFITWPTRQVHNVKYYINNRWITRTHTLTASSLEKGKWHEFDTRLLHCMFDELVNYIEVEEAWSNIAWDKEARAKYNAPFYSWGWFRWRTWRCPEAGLDKLKWAASLTNEEFLDDDKKHEAELTPQAKTAIELMALYDWWKNVRPKRPDPHDASGWTELCEKRRQGGRDFLDFEDRTEEEQTATRESLDLCHKIEEQYFEEDTEMMARLIKIRRGIWT
jgi:hypothetical protein